MLTQLRMKNFLSFKEETIIDVSATGYKTLTGTNVYNDTLKGSLFVGANASGKTNVIQALKLLLDLLFAEKILNMGLRRCLFSQEKSFTLEYDFAIEGDTINYLVEYHVIEKSFTEKLKVNDRAVLDRIGNSGESEITDNKLFTDIAPDSLLLREVYFNTKFRNQPVLKAWFDFLLHSVYVDGYHRAIFSPGNHPLELEDYLEAGGVESINEFFEKHDFNQRIEYSHTSSGNFTKLQTLREKDIFFKRESIGEPIPYPLESLGSQNLLHLLPPFFHVIKNGGMLIVDEFSSAFHNFLEELLIKYFMKHSEGSQLFLVSHSTNLLTNSLLRPDQIYAVDFNGMEGSKVKRFSSGQPRVAQNLEKMYTSGVFGGVPQYRDEDNPF